MRRGARDAQDARPETFRGPLTCGGSMGCAGGRDSCRPCNRKVPGSSPGAGSAGEAVNGPILIGPLTPAVDPNVSLIKQETELVDGGPLDLQDGVDVDRLGDGRRAVAEHVLDVLDRNALLV